MLRGAGIFLVIASCSGLGFYAGAQLSRRLAQIRELIRIFTMLQGEIEYSRTSLPEAFRVISKRTREPFCSFLDTLSTQLSAGQGQPFSVLFAALVQQYLPGTALKDRDLQELNRAGSQLGYLDKEMQLRTIHLYLQELDETAGSLKGELAQKQKIWQSLGIAAGVLLVVLFL